MCLICRILSQTKSSWIKANDPSKVNALLNAMVVEPGRQVIEDPVDQGVSLGFLELRNMSDLVICELQSHAFALLLRDAILA